MSFTRADVDAMDDAIKRGVRSVTLESGQSIQYPSVDELIQARNLAVHEVNRATAAAAGRASTYSLADFS